MSTDYGVYCMNCKDAYIIDNLRDPKCALDCVTNATKLGLLSKQFDFADIEVRISYNNRIDLSFFELHHTHKLEVIDEYGRFWPNCNKKIELHHWCTLKAGHIEECSKLCVYDHKK